MTEDLCRRRRNLIAGLALLGAALVATGYASRGLAVKWLLPLLLAGCAVPQPKPVDWRDSALRLEFADGVCSATAIGPDKLLTAGHCMTDELRTVDGTAVAVVSIVPAGVDVVEVAVAGVRFVTWSERAQPVQGERVRWIGQPRGEADVYGEGYVAKVAPEGVIFVGMICKGMSGAGLHNDAGEVVGVISAMSDPYGCTVGLAH